MTLALYLNRKRFRQFLRQNRAISSENNPSLETAKIKKAKSLNVPVISEDQLNNHQVPSTIRFRLLWSILLQNAERH